MEDRCVMCGADVSDLSTHICKTCMAQFDICFRCKYFTPFSASYGECRLHYRGTTNNGTCDDYEEGNF